MVYAVSYILFDIVTWRAGVLPRWAGAVVSVGTFLSYLVMLPINVSGMVVSIGMIGLGRSLNAANTAAVKSSQLQTA